MPRRAIQYGVLAVTPTGGTEILFQAPRTGADILACVNNAPGFPALSAYNPTTMVLAVEDESTYRFRALTVPQAAPVT
jgi:hypothetical protein